MLCVCKVYLRKTTFKSGISNYTTQYMYFNHLRLTNSTTMVGDRPLRNICQKLTITALPGNQFIVTPQKTSVAKKEYPQFDTTTAPLEVTHPTFYTVCIFYLRISFQFYCYCSYFTFRFYRCARDLLAKTKNIVYCIVCFKIR